ncbi:hypothetical protein BO78DRAFT_415164 [Aspergillus sclerotiicarbonarius CBS 121057]|uniref:Uncharacterized protein n=1 Tax=Aspergillus sclerotiicarbonarius (strain CBS 121057 / IBT 28362) TaxID=1448318 RepID=A0A319EQQ8_ASPSB|nr:hypothetical protein BO78DRAFT_415164 [Aspergillus sclerotiicarbonarius CBS 121057]
MNREKRKQRWIDSKTLRKDATLLALLDAEDPDDASAVFLLVSKRYMSYVNKATQSTFKPDRVSNVTADDDKPLKKASNPAADPSGVVAI